MNRRYLITPGLLLAVFVASLVTFYAAPQPLERRLLYFPDTAGGNRHAEWHFVPRRSNAVDRIRVFVDELRLGPVELGSVPFIPESAEVRSIVLDNDQVLYIDFTPDIMFDESDSERNFADLEELLTDNLHHNFRNLKRTVVLIGGQVPNAPSLREISR